MRKSIHISAVLFCFCYSSAFTQERESKLYISTEINNRSDILSNGRLPENPYLSPINIAEPLKGNKLFTNDTIYGVDMGDRNYIHFETDEMENLNILSPWPGALQSLTNASEIVIGDNNHMYEIDKIGDVRKVNLIDGSYSLLGNIEIYPLAMALDYSTGIYYFSTENDWLYSIDMVNLTYTAIGPFDYSGWQMIGMTCDGNGDLYGYDLSNDNLWSINKATGAATLIGPIGFDANFGQGMAYDQVNDQVVLSAFNYDSFQCEYRIADLVTGNTTLVGPIGTPAHTQVTTICLPVNFVSIDERNKQSENYLGQNAPNPCKDETWIEYKLVEDSDVTLRLYNNQGITIQKPLSKLQQAGEYRLKLTVSDMHPGIYFYQMIVQNRGTPWQQTRSFVVSD